MPGKLDIILCSLLVLIKIKAYPQFQPESKNMGKHRRAHIMQAAKKSAFPMTNKKGKVETGVNLYPFFFFSFFLLFNLPIG